MTGPFLVVFGWPLWLGVIGGILVGSLIGLVNGFARGTSAMQPMIATLAMMLVCAGLALVISGGEPIYLNGGSRAFRGDLARHSGCSGCPTP